MGPDRIHGFQISYYNVELPKDWKSANVVPVHKKGSKADIENYRPISLTSTVVQTLERLFRDEVMSRCSTRIDQSQHGFLFAKSCGTQLLGFAIA